MNPKVLYFALFVAFFLLNGCNSDQDQMKKLEGHWELKDAEMNGISSMAMMQGIFMDLEEPSRITTNFNATAETISGKYTISNQNLQCNFGQNNQSFVIQGIKDSLLELNTELVGKEYKLLFVKGVKMDSISIPSTPDIAPK